MTQAPSKPTLTLPEIEKREEALRLVLVEKSFIHFLDHVYIMEPPQAFAETSAGGGRTPFEKWPHLIELAEAFEHDPRIVVGKSRQIGFSWIVAAYALWKILFHEGAVVLMLSRGETEAQVLLGKARTIYAYLPKRWQKQRKRDKDSGSEFAIGSMSSKITALASTKDAGRSETASLVIADESDFHEYGAENLAAVGPTIDAGGQIIVGSTSNKRKARSSFKGFIRNSPQNGWKKFFFGWQVRPGRTQAWYDFTKANIPDEALTEMSPDLYMEQEYPGTEDEMMAPARAGAWFDQDMLRDLEVYTQSPIATPIEDDYRGKLCFYIRRTPRGRYSSGTDLGHGVGADFSATVVLDLHAGRIVADLMDNTIPPDEFIEESIKLLKVYNRPIWGIERNALGIEANDLALTLRYPRLFHRETSRTRGAERHQKAEPGWQTDSRNRWLLYGELKRVVDSGEFIVPNKEGLAHFWNIIKVGQMGEPVCQLGANDDYVVACGIAYQMRHQAFASQTGFDPMMASLPPTAPSSW
jgi:hypothetical protein